MGEKLKSYVILPKASRLDNVLSKISTVDEDGEECEEYYEESYIRPNICYNSSEKIHDYIDWLCSVQKEKDRKEEAVVAAQPPLFVYTKENCQ